MKHRYMMLSLLISGSRQPRNDIDVYLPPLIDDLKLLWDEGVRTYDALSIKSYKACPVCGEGTHARHLSNCRKMVYMGYQRFLPRHHPYR
ncbi:unnamed protein product [Rhodiola kirilowii]